MTAFIPEPQTMLMLYAGTSWGIPALIATWRPIPWPLPAPKTLPQINSSTFAAKRLKMMELDKSGSYIPICTRNVFCKYYNLDAENFSFWTTEDRKTYRKAIIDTLTEAGFPPKFNEVSNIESEEE